MSKGMDAMTYFAEHEMREAFADRDFSDWAWAFYEDRIFQITERFQTRLNASVSWSEGWAAFQALRSELNEFRREHEDQQHVSGARAYLAEIGPQVALL